jgi:hypothetical protein
MFELLLHAAHAHVLAAPAVSLTEHSGHATMAGQKNVPTHQLNLVGGTNEVYNRSDTGPLDARADTPTCLCDPCRGWPH